MMERASSDAEQPRVVMVVKRLHGTGGMQLQARGVARSLKGTGAACCFVSGSRKRTSPDQTWVDGTLAHNLRYQFNPQFYAALVRWLCRERSEYDVIHVHGLGGVSLAAGLAGRRARRPVVVKPSTAGPGTMLDRWARLARACPPFGSLLRAGVDRWIAISEQTRADLLRLGVPDARIVKIPNGVDIARFMPPADRRAARRSLGADPSARVILTVARLQPHKQVDMLIRALGRVAAAVPGAVLWVVGVGPEAVRLRELADALGLSARVRWLGGVRPAEMPAVYAAAAVFALVSRSEGLSNALLEAMATGLAPIVSRVSGSADVVSHGVNGYLCAPEDEGAVADSLASLLQDEALCNRLGTAARQRVASSYSLDQTAGALLEVYRSLPARTDA